MGGTPVPDHGPAAKSPWEELAEQAQRQSSAGRAQVTERDHALRAAVRSGSSVRELADLTGVSVQAVYQAVERAEAEVRQQAGTGYEQTLAALEGMTDAVAFEELT